MLRATAALRNKEVFVALNTWRSYARERRVWSARIGGALKALSPEGRAMLRAINSWRRMVEERQMMMKVTTALALATPAFPSPLIFPLPMLSSPQLEQEPMPAPSSLVAPPQDDLARLSVEAAPHAEPPNEYDEQMASAHLVASLVADAERALAAVLMSPAPRLRF